MSIFNKIKHYAFAAVTGLSTPDSVTGDGMAGDVASAVKDFVADLGVSSSIQRQLIGIEQTINKEMVDLGPYAARQAIKSIPMGIIENRDDCSIYDARPSDKMKERSGALVFV